MQAEKYKNLYFFQRIFIFLIAFLILSHADRADLKIFLNPRDLREIIFCVRKI